MSRIFTLVVLIAFALAMMFSLLLAVADYEFRRGTPESVASALRLLPGNTRYLGQRALQMEYEDQDSAPLLEKAAALNPLSSAPRIRLGLLAEARGDRAGAEKWLLDAAHVDHQFEPAWTLANFYFRQGAGEKQGDDYGNQFWQWMHTALDVSYGDRRPAFDLCWRVAGDPQQILDRAVPPNREVLAPYLSYLLDQHRDAVGPAALKLASVKAPEDTPVLEAASDALIDAGKTAQAQELWKQLGHGGRGLLTNGDFSAEPRGHGFDWRPQQPGGVTHLHLTSPAGHRIIFSGKQPEVCDLLREFVVLRSGKRYRLKWESRTAKLQSPTGIQWNAGTTDIPVEKSDDWRAGTAVWTAPSDLASLTLRYRRPTGQSRAEGSIEIRNVELTPE